MAGLDPAIHENTVTVPGTDGGAAGVDGRHKAGDDGGGRSLNG